mmetsp:Transcript_95870/g.293234  ORF Transcript_95870/g.293234 Transcript_95870/m.293234 type:complete len:203 (-) Transcript_95870:317-925(-)
MGCSPFVHCLARRQRGGRAEHRRGAIRSEPRAGDQRPAVQGELRACEVRAGPAGQEQARAGGVGRRAEPPQRSAGGDVALPGRLDRTPHHARHEGPGTDRVHRHVSAADRHGQMLGQHQHRGLARAVGVRVQLGDLHAVDARDVDHAAGVLRRARGLEQRQSELRQAENRVGVDAHHLLEHVRRVLAQGGVEVRAAVVHEHV